MTFCIIYNYTCVKNTLSLNFLFNYLMCKPHFREFSPPVLFSGNHWVCDSINLSYINSGLSLRFLFYVCFLINHEQKWGSSLSKTTSGRTTSSLRNFSVRENVWFGGFFFITTLLFATDSYVSNSVCYGIAQLRYVFSTDHKSPKTFVVYGFKCALKIYWPWGFKVFHRNNIIPRGIES